jgi:hypothetical protein
MWFDRPVSDAISRKTSTSCDFRISEVVHTAHASFHCLFATRSSITANPSRGFATAYARTRVCKKCRRPRLSPPVTVPKLRQERITFRGISWKSLDTSNNVDDSEVDQMGKRIDLGVFHSDWRCFGYMLRRISPVSSQRSDLLPYLTFERIRFPSIHVMHLEQERPVRGPAWIRRKKA